MEKRRPSMSGFRSPEARRYLLAILTATLAAGLLGAPLSLAQNFGGSHDRYFTVEWRTVEDRGRPTVAGHVRNEWNTAARNLQISVVELNAAGEPVATVIASVYGEVSPGGHGFFKAPVRSLSATYRVTIQSYAWVHRGR
jgi:hypothetical protein